ncbi:MAG: 50S ribosomal protein L10 [Phycisphaerae bacterium]|nr:50S ribosomal protein L10 [Phycisphaerae bacterium]
MSRKVKQLLETNLASRYGAAKEALVVNVLGLTGVEANQLRGILRKKEIELHVVPNRAMRRVIGTGALAPIAKELKGACALVTGKLPAVEIAKELTRLAADYPKLELKFGLIEGMDETMPFDRVAAMRTRVELIGEVVMLANSPGRRLAACVAGPGRRVAGCIKAIAEKLENGETIAKVA